MTYLHRVVKATEVGNHRDTEGLDATMMGHNHLRDCRHTDGIASEDTVHLVFGRCLEGRTLNAHIDTVLHLDAFLTGNLVGLVDQLQVVGLMHIRETGTCGEVLTTQRMLWEEVNVVGDDHQVANLKFWIHTTGSVGYEEGLDAQFVHHSDREGDLLHRVALVKVEASLHGEDVDTTQLTEDEFARMAFYGRYGEIGNLGVGIFGLVSYF